MIMAFFSVDYYLMPTRRGEANANYRDPGVRKRARAPNMLHMFLYFSIESLFADCTILYQAKVTLQLTVFPI